MYLAVKISTTWEENHLSPKSMLLLCFCWTSPTHSAMKLERRLMLDCFLVFQILSASRSGHFYLLIVYLTGFLLSMSLPLPHTFSLGLHSPTTARTALWWASQNGTGPSVLTAHDLWSPCWPFPLCHPCSPVLCSIPAISLRLLYELGAPCPMLLHLPFLLPGNEDGVE